MKEKGKSVLYHILIFTGAMIASRLTLFNICLPCSAAVCAALPLSSLGVCGMAGALLGTLTLGGAFDSLRMFCCALIIIGIRVALDGFKIKTPIYPALLCFVVVMSTGIVSLSRFSGTLDYVTLFFVCAFGALLSSALWCYVGTVPKAVRRMSGIFIAIVAALSIAITDIAGVYLGRIAVLCFAAVSAQYAGIAVAIVCASLCGIMLSGGGDYLSCALIPILSIFMSLLGKKKKQIFLMLYFAALAFGTAFMRPQIAFCRVIECVAAYLLTLCLPEEKITFFFSKAERYFTPANTAGDMLKQTADVLRDMQQQMGKICSGVKPSVYVDVSVLSDALSKEVCIYCKRRNECWIGSFGDMMDSLYKAAGHLKSGTAMNPLLLEGKLSTCIKGGELCNVLNREYSAVAGERGGKLAAQTAAIVEDISACIKKGEIIKQSDTGIVIESASRTKSGETASGDRIVAFKDRGREIILISDGMGSGEIAGKYSEFVSDSIKRLIKAGISPETAMMVAGNIIESAEGDYFATADMLVIDCASLEAQIIKAGAASSVLRRKDKFYNVSGSMPPLGIEGGKAEITTLKLKENDMIMLFSDGVTDCDENCTALTSIAENFDDASGQTLPSYMISRLEEVSRDDMSIVCVSVRKKSKIKV